VNIGRHQSEDTSEEKRELLKKIIKEKAEKVKLAPLSYSQQRLWFIDQLHKNNSAYNLHKGFRFIGNLNIEVFNKAINEIIQRHDSLRTTFAIKDGQPVQLVGPFFPIVLKVLDISNLSNEEIVRFM
jgi:hypothetical protein